jgi:hypothetical protein
MTNQLTPELTPEWTPIDTLHRAAAGAFDGGLWGETEDQMLIGGFLRLRGSQTEGGCGTEVKRD